MTPEADRDRGLGQAASRQLGRWRSPGGERFHQTLKRWLAKQRGARAIDELQAQPDRFAVYYNTVRPHRALNRNKPSWAFAARPKATTSAPVLQIPSHTRVRKDKIDSHGVITLRYRSRLHHIGIGRRLAGTRVLILVADLQVRVVSEDGELLRELMLDPSRDYQARSPPA